MPSSRGRSTTRKPCADSSNGAWTASSPTDRISCLIFWDGDNLPCRPKRSETKPKGGRLRQTGNLFYGHLHPTHRTNPRGKGAKFRVRSVELAEPRRLVLARRRRKQLRLQFRGEDLAPPIPPAGLRAFPLQERKSHRSPDGRNVHERRRRRIAPVVHRQRREARPARDRQAEHKNHRPRRRNARPRGVDCALEAEQSGDELLFNFKDGTNADTTYGGGRRFYLPPPEGDEIILDFNLTDNWPCAYTPFATCPIPPRQNVLKVRVEAGEKVFK
ncbi:MAG: DUF1684 domain-containing protein [Chloroflexi bacterium CFX1]|nr:DUF1684 domain-containing protein [Chloroflexi bacterium CFX1]